MSFLSYSNNIFINCPFDDDYLPILRSIVFCVFDCGYIPRCAREIDDSGQVRIEKISKLISECKFGIHDISRTELDAHHQLPRFNMPLELGMYFGAKRFGNKNDKNKITLILDREPHRYQIFISDIAGQDIKSHKNQPKEAIRIISSWLRNTSRRITIPGGAEIIRRYSLFMKELPQICNELRIGQDELDFNDYSVIVSKWLQENPQ